MSGPDKGKLEPDKTLIEPDVPEVPYSQTTDFSVSTNSGMSDPDSAQVDVYSTQFADRSAPTDGNKKNDTGKSGVASDALSSSKNQLPVDIPGFVVESELGRGAFGVVYCARDQFLDRRVAIKKPLISNPAHRQQYIDEARKAVKLDHPSIVPIYQVGMTTNDEPFVVQKLIEGSTLRDLLKNGDGKLPLLQTVSIMRQVCLAVDAAHVAGIVHRDLKPENLLVEPEGRVYVADFGLAILEDDEQNKKGREVAGTPLYMSPEQFAGRVEWLDGRSDIWALGVILYELLSGKTPFSGSSLNELKDQIKNKDPRPIHQRDPKVPSAFDAMFRKCCAKNVGDRYASAREMIAELDAITESLPYMDTINLMSQGRTGSFKGMGSSVGSGLGSGVGSSQGGLTSHGLNAYGSAQSTLRNSMGGTTVRERSTGWKLVGPILISVAVLGSLTCAAWFAKLGPFAAVELASVEPDPNKNASVEPVPVEKVPKSDIGNSLAGTTEKKSSEPKVEPKPLPPSKPFTVSIDGKGTHDSIAKAIADSDAGETVRILAGTYRESLVIDRSIKIVGDGAVSILSTKSSCIKIQADSNVQIENVTFDCQAAEFNAIDLVGGKLTLNKCVVFAGSLASYNCVKARANTTFVADRCKFESMLDANVSGEITSTITIRDSNFSFSRTDSGLKRIGIQAKGSQGLIQRCSFTGPCSSGIDWMESPDQKLTIEDCQFDNCRVGIQCSGCNNVLIKGSTEMPLDIRNADYGLSIKHSKVDVSGVVAKGTSDPQHYKKRVSMQITEDSSVKCANCDFMGFVLRNLSQEKFDRYRQRNDSRYNISWYAGR